MAPKEPDQVKLVLIVDIEWDLKEPDQVKLVLIVNIEWDIPLYTASIYIFGDYRL